MTEPKSDCFLTDELICYMAKCTLIYGKEETERRIKEVIREVEEECHKPCRVREEGGEDD